MKDQSSSRDPGRAPGAASPGSRPGVSTDADDIVIFISYRRSDTRADAGRLHDALRRRFSKDQLFKDVDSLRPGEDFVVAIDQAMARSDVLLALIGTEWTSVLDRDGSRRLDNETDRVRLEIASALVLGKWVIPVLFDGATMPRAAELPEPLKSLARKEAVRIQHDAFQIGLDKLVRQLRTLQKEKAERRVIEEERQRQEAAPAAEAKRAADEEERQRQEAEELRRQEEEELRRQAEAADAQAEAADAQAAAEADDRRRQAEAAEVAQAAAEAASHRRLRGRVTRGHIAILSGVVLAVVAGTWLVAPKLFPIQEERFPRTTIAPATQPADPAGYSCANVPTFDPLASPLVGPHVDPDLEALFPTEIAGEPLENLVSIRWVNSLCLHGGQSAVDQALAGAPSGISLAALTYAIGSYGDTVDVTAYRTPGQDAGIMIQNFWPAMLAIFGAPAATQPPGTMAPTSIGGKSAFVWTGQYGRNLYLYPRGDVLFVTDMTEAQASTVFAALP